jgi:hypothetical protein
VFHGPDFTGIRDTSKNLHDKFRSLGSEQQPRSYKCGGVGSDPDVKLVVLWMAGMLEGLQRWRQDAPAPVYAPTEAYDYDQITEFLNQLIQELRDNHDNVGGQLSPPWTPQPLPKSWQANPDQVSGEYDEWVRARVREFRDELKLKTNIAIKPDPQPVADALGEVSALLKQILSMLPA